MNMVNCYTYSLRILQDFKSIDKIKIANICKQTKCTFCLPTIYAYHREWMKYFTKSCRENRSLLYIQNKMKKKIREKESNLIKQSITLNICWYMLSFAKSLNLHVLPFTQRTSWHSKKYLHFLTLLISIHITLSSNLPYSQFFQNSTYFNDNYQTVLVEVIDIMYIK